MGDEDIGHVVPRLQPPEQVNDLGLNGHVQGAGRLVQDQQPGPQDKRPGNGDALALPA